MKKTEFYHLLAQTAEKYPALAKEIQQLVESCRKSDTDTIDDDVLLSFWKRHHITANDFASANDFDSSSGTDNRTEGRVFKVHSEFSKEIKQRLRLADRDMHYRNWANAVNGIPDATSPLPKVDQTFIENATQIWKENVYGNENILQALLRHSVEYSRKGTTMPILLVGDPGTGKSYVAQNYGKILNLPTSFLNGPSASAGRGLSGAPNLYIGAGVGAVVQAMLDHGIGNPVLVIDEIDKATQGYSRAPNFQNELLSALDERNTGWVDNFLEVPVDASHIPYIFTANDKENIIQPLLDRMEVIHMENPSKEMLHGMIKSFTLPQVFSDYSDKEIEFGENELDLLVELLWRNGGHSCRVYQKAVNLLISDAYFRSIATNKPAKIEEGDVQAAVEMSLNNKQKAMGFVLH